MDTAIGSEGDLEMDAYGRPVLISGAEELRQRVFVRLAAKKGCFIYDRELGSNVYKVDLTDGSADKQIEEIAREALGPVRQAEVKGVEIDGDDIRISVALNGEMTVLCITERSGT